MLDLNKTSTVYTELQLYFHRHCRCSLFQKAVAIVAHLLTASKTATKTAPKDPNLAPREPQLARYLRTKSWIKKNQRRDIGRGYFQNSHPHLKRRKDPKEMVRKIPIGFGYSL